MDIRIKRIYEPAAPEDGERYLVDRLWPRGAKRVAAHLSGWFKDVAPSDALRRWFGHEPARWNEFRRRYLAELEALSGPLRLLREAVARGPVTLVYSARDEAHNQAVVLRDFLLQRPTPPSKSLGVAPAGVKRRTRAHTDQSHERTQRGP